MDAWLIDPNYSGNKGYETYLNPTKIEKKENDGGIYIEVENKIERKFKCGDLRFPLGAAKHLKAYLDFEDDIYAVKTKDIPNLGDGWQSLDEVLVPYVKDIISEYTDEEINNTEQAIKYIYDNTYSHLSGVKDHILKHLNKDSPMHEYITASNELLTEQKNQEKFKVALRQFGYLFNEANPSVSSSDSSGKQHPIVKMNLDIRAMYPILRGLNNYSSSVTGKEMAEYINLVDANVKLQSQNKISNVA
jgi:hypothetical protein